MAETTRGNMRGLDAAYQVIWQALTDALYFYERHAYGGAMQVAEALRALEQLRALAKSTGIAVDHVPAMNPPHSHQIKPASRPRQYPLWSGARRAS